MAKFQAPSANQFMKFMIFGLVFLFLITRLIDLNAAVTGEGDILKDIPDDFLTVGFQAVLAGMAMWLAWMSLGIASGRWDKRKFVTFLIAAAVMFIIYNNVLVGSGLIPGLQPLKFSAVQLQSIVAP